MLKRIVTSLLKWKRIAHMRRRGRDWLISDLKKIPLPSSLPHPQLSQTLSPKPVIRRSELPVCNAGLPFY